MARSRTALARSAAWTRHPPDPGEAPPQYSHIVREAGDLTVLGADLADVIWSGCSSIAHGDLSRTLGILDKQIVARDKGVAYARVTGSISGPYWTTAGAVRMIEQGFNLYRHRAAGHY